MITGNFALKLEKGFNPPYMGSNGMNKGLLNYIRDKFPDSKSDFYSIFIEICLKNMIKENGYVGMMTSYTWMFLSSFKKLRKNVLENNHIVTLVQPEYHSFFEEANVPICGFVVGNIKCDYIGEYVRLEEFTGADNQEPKYLEAVKNKKCGYRYSVNQKNFLVIPDMPIAYWLSNNIFKDFEKTLMQSVSDLKQGLITGDNDRFLRNWYECSTENISCDEGDKKKWHFYHKGGLFRRWYGNISLVVNWDNDGFDIINFRDEKGKQRSRPQNIQYYFREGFTWTALTIADFNVRYLPKNSIFDAKGSSGFVHDKGQLLYVIGFCNTKVCNNFLSVISPTMDYNAGVVAKVPFVYDGAKKNRIDEIVNENMEISKSDWDYFETSWDFKRHPLIPLPWRGGAVGDGVVTESTFSAGDHPGLTATPPQEGNGKRFIQHYMSLPYLIPLPWRGGAVGDGVVTESTFSAGDHPGLTATPPQEGNGGRLADCYEAYKQVTNKCFDTLKKNEEELNRIFIDIYGLSDELTPDVADKDVTVARIYDTKEEIPDSMKGNNYVLTREDVVKSLISYAVGCMFGRYSLDEPGLICAGGEFDPSKYETYHPDEDAIIPICDDEYFEDDIVERFCIWLKAAFGEEHYRENLQFIADALEGKGTPLETIRSYFLSDFYTDHCKRYQKRPIYWLFDAGKKNSFKALVYIHRYDKDTIARMRTGYVYKQQELYKTRIETTQNRIDTAASQADKNKFKRDLKKLREQFDEIHVYEEKIHHYADLRQEIDLDDGVKHNYALFADILAKIK